MSGRRAARVDANQTEIVDALRKVGVNVVSLAAVGDGVPDLLCGLAGILFLVEAKDGAKAPRARRLTPDQVTFHEKWRAFPVFVVESVEQALSVVAAVRRVSEATGPAFDRLTTQLASGRGT